MIRLSTVRTVFAAIVLLGLSPVILLWHPVASTSTNCDDAASKLRSLLPDSDGLLVNRVSLEWGDTAVAAARAHGLAGVQVLDSFGDEAAYLMREDPKAFESLTQVMTLDPKPFELASGPWKRAVLDWAQSGKLKRFLTSLQSVPPDRWAITDRAPASLPLVLCPSTRTAHAMLLKWGDRAWRLFLTVDLEGSPADVERVADALAEHGELMLDLNDNCGLQFALLLVSSESNDERRRLPDLVRYAWTRAADRAVATTLVASNLSDVAQMLGDDRTAGCRTIEQLIQAVDVVLSLPAEIQELAVEHPRVLRLCSETWNGRIIGAEAFARCGPAATIAYDAYGSEDRLRLAALVAMADCGWPAFELLEKFSGYGNFIDLLRRDELLNAADNPPLVDDVVGRVAAASNPQAAIDKYTGSKNLAGQLMAERYPPSPSEPYLEWVPGYVAYRTLHNHFSGLDVPPEDAFWATIDAVSTATLIYGPVVSGLKSVGTKVSSEAVKGVAKAGGRQLERKAAADVEQTLARRASDVARRVIEQEGQKLSRFGGNAARISEERLLAQTKKGLKLALKDRREEWLAKASDLQGRVRLAEEIGEEGASQYAVKVGYEPLYRGSPGKGMGFDQVYRDGDRIKVIEAKGGSSQPKVTYGQLQGTCENAMEVAKRTLARPNASNEERDAAEHVLKAFDSGHLDVEVVRTEHVLGTPTVTRVESVTSTGQLSTAARVAERRTLVAGSPGALTSIVRESLPTTLKRLPVERQIRLADGTARIAGIRLWDVGANGPFAERVVTRQGRRVTVRPGDTANLIVEGADVGDLPRSIMERMLR